MATKKSITRRWVGTGTNGKVETYSEQRYISKHSRSFLQGVKDNANWKLYCRLFSKAFASITKGIENGNYDSELINSTGIFTTDHTDKSISLQHLPKQSFLYVRRKCLDGALLLLSGNSHLGVTAPKEETARQATEDLFAWADIILGTREDSNEIDSKWNGFGFTCVPFSTVEEHDEWKDHSKLLTDRWNITLSKERFETYLPTMNDYSFSRTDKTLDSANYHDRVKYVLDRLTGISTESIREFKNTLYSTKQAIKLGRKLPICRLAVYDNWKLKGDDADE